MTINATNLIYVVKDKAGYNENILGVIDDDIREAIENYILKEWWIKCSLGELAKLYAEKYNDNIKMIIRNSLSLRKPSLV